MSKNCNRNHCPAPKSCGKRATCKHGTKWLNPPAPAPRKRGANVPPQERRAILSLLSEWYRNENRLVPYPDSELAAMLYEKGFAVSKEAISNWRKTVFNLPAHRDRTKAYRQGSTFTVGE